MSITWFDGFDELGTTSSADNLLTESGYLTASDTRLTNNPARTGNALSLESASLGSNIANLKLYLGEKGEWIVGFAIYFTGFASNEQIFNLTWHDGVISRSHLLFKRNNVNGVEFRILPHQSSTENPANASYTNSSGTQIAVSPAQVIQFNTWHYIEVRAKIDNAGTTGSLECRVDNVCVINETGIQTSNQDSNIWNVINFVGPSFNLGSDFPVNYLDDFYVIDPNDAVGNVTFLGDSRVYTQLPDANGDENDFSVHGAASNYQAVDDTAPDDDTTYTYSATPGDIDLYSVPALPATVVEVFAVMATSRARKTDAGDRSYKVMMKLGSDTLESDLIQAQLTYTGRQFLSESKPGGGAWAPADIANVQVGVEVVG